MSVRFSDLKVLLENHMFPQITYKDEGKDFTINRDGERFSCLIDGSDDTFPHCKIMDDVGMIEQMVQFYYDYIDDYNQGTDYGLGPGILSQYETWRKYYPALRKKKAPLNALKVKGMSFYSICPKERLPFSDAEASKLGDFCKYFFENKYKKFIEKCWWVVESGKYSEQPNLHIHALISFKPGIKNNFKRDIHTAWMQKEWYYTKDCKYRLNWTSDDGVGIHRVPCNTALIQADKIKYMENDHKGSHENFVDLGISGRY